MRRRLLEGFFTLKREAMVELLAACSEHASQEDLRQLEKVCLALEEATRWGEQSSWPQREFELLRLAALVAQRPGHFLLVQSLERSFRGIAARVVPHLDREAVFQWARYVLGALGDRDAQALRRQLTALLQAGDEQLLHRMVPVPPAQVVPEVPPSPQPPAVDSSQPGPARGPLAGAVCPNLTGCRTGQEALPPLCQTEPLSPGRPEPELAGSALAEAVRPNVPDCPTASCHAPPTGRAPSSSAFTGFGPPADHREFGAGMLPGHPEEAGGDTGSPVSWERAPSPGGTTTGAPEPANRAQASASGSQWRAAVGHDLPEPDRLSDCFAPYAVNGEPGTGRPPSHPPKEPWEGAKTPTFLAMLRWMLRWIV